ANAHGGQVARIVRGGARDVAANISEQRSPVVGGARVELDKFVVDPQVELVVDIGEHHPVLPLVGERGGPPLSEGDGLLCLPGEKLETRGASGGIDDSAKAMSPFH